MDADYNIFVNTLEGYTERLVCPNRDVTHLAREYTPNSFSFLDFDGTEHEYDVWEKTWSTVQSEIDLCIAENNRKYQRKVAAGEIPVRNEISRDPPFLLNLVVNWFGGLNSLGNGDGKSNSSVSSDSSSGVAVFFVNICCWFIGLLGPALGLKLTISLWRACLGESFSFFSIWLFPFAFMCSVTIGIISVGGLATYLVYIFYVMFGSKDSLIGRIASLLVIAAATALLFVRLGFLDDLPWAARHLGIFLVWVLRFIGAVLWGILRFIWNSILELWHFIIGAS